MSPRISVIIPSFNHAEHLTNAVQSVLGQTLTDIEIVIVDDHSSDNSREVIERINDPRVQKIFLPSNTGGCNALNVGIESTRGKFIAICNSDDKWESDKLEKQLSILEQNPIIGAVFSEAKWIDSNGKEIDGATVPFFHVFKQKNVSRAAWLRRLVEFGNCLCHPSILIRREVYDACGRYDDFYRQLPDYEMWLRVVQNFEIFVVKEPLVSFRILDGGRNTSAPSPANTTRISNEKRLILQGLFAKLDKRNFLSAFGSIKAPHDPLFSLPIEKFLYLVSREGQNEVAFRDIGLTLLRETFDFSQNGRRILQSYGLNTSAIHTITGLSSPFLAPNDTAPSRQTKFMTNKTTGPSRRVQKRIDELEHEYNSLLKSYSWKLTRGLRELNKSSQSSSIKVVSSSHPNSVPEHRLSELTMSTATNTSKSNDKDVRSIDRLTSLTEAITAIKQSRSWKTTDPLRRLKRAIGLASRTTDIQFAEPNGEMQKSGLLNLAIFASGSSTEFYEAFLEETLSYLEEFDTHIYSTDLEFLENCRSKLNFSKFKDRFQFFDGSMAVPAQIAYCHSFADACRFFPYFQKNQLPFIFSFYCDQALDLGEVKTSLQAKELCSTNSLKAVICPSKTESNYLLENKCCTRQKIIEYYGSVLPAVFETFSWSEKKLFGIHKNSLDVAILLPHSLCSEELADVTNLVQDLAERIAELNFHFIGNFDNSTSESLKNSSINGRMTFHQRWSLLQLRQTFCSIDLLIPLDAILELPQDKRFRGISYAATAAAGLCGVTVFSKNGGPFQYSTNGFPEVTTNTEFQVSNQGNVVDFLESALKSPVLLSGMAWDSLDAFRQKCGWDAQMQARLELFHALIPGL